MFLAHLDELALSYLRDHEQLLQINDGDGSKGGGTRGGGSRGGSGSGTGNTASWLQVVHRMWLIMSLNFQRAMVLRLRSRTSLITYALIHVIMACALSSGFSIYLQTSYLSVLSPPVDVALQAYFPTVLRTYSEKNVCHFPAYHYLLILLAHM